MTHDELSADPTADHAAPLDALDLICFSHLRWNFVFQRPQHLMTRFAAHHRVFFVEEPIYQDGPDRLQLTCTDGGVQVVVPALAEWRRGGDSVTAVQRALLRRMMRGERVRRYALWFLTPMALPLTRDLSPQTIVYDCMDELSGFAGAPAALPELEEELLARAALVTTGGRSLYESKRGRHANVHAFPSSVDLGHFARARDAGGPEPEDQAAIPRPRLGYAGVIDERMDVALVRAVAEAHPDWQIVLLGPTAKIDPAVLPRLPNVHRLGMKSYGELPDYLAGWDVGLLPFAHNDATRFISPTKTPEYLAAGLPVVATAIRDVVTPYGDAGLARIADGPEAFGRAVADALAEGRCGRLSDVDQMLGQGSWDETAERMRALMLRTLGTEELSDAVVAGGDAP
jgi:UDP-galactopyranose mutase